MAERKFYRIVELDAPPPLESLGEGESVVECNLYRTKEILPILRWPEGELFAFAEIYGRVDLLKSFLESQIFHGLEMRAPFIWHFGADARRAAFVKASGMRESLAFLERWNPDKAAEQKESDRLRAAEQKESERLRGIVKFLESELTRLNAQQKGAMVSA